MSERTCTIGVVTSSPEAPRMDGLTEEQARRALGAVVAAAAGDALGAPYEFLSPIDASEDVEMLGGGILGWEPGEWTDDTAMSFAVLQAVADAPSGATLLDESVLDAVAASWFRWSLSATDIGALTSIVVEDAVLFAHGRGRNVPSAADFREAAQKAHRELDQSAGNGALMRVYAAVVGTLRESDDVAERAIDALTELTHVDQDAREASILWGFIVRHAIFTGRIDAQPGLARLSQASQDIWRSRLEEAEVAEPRDFPRNGWVVSALQAAWSAVCAQMPLPADKFAARDALARGLEMAVRSGNDTDTVASIAGALLGGALGAKAVPTEWRRLLHGWPEAELHDLMIVVERLLSRRGC